MQKNILKVYLQIILLATSTFAFSYLVDQTNPKNQIYDLSSQRQTEVNINVLDYNSGSPLEKNLLKLIINLLFSDKNFVSALDYSDIRGGIATCINSETGKNCQEYISSECSAQCDGTCIPSSRNQVSECKLGTCYDKQEGLCSTNSPKGLCELNSGRWFADQYGNVPECKRGCCFINEQPFFTTEQACRAKSSQLGIKKNFKPELDTEIACILQAQTQEEGACILPSSEQDSQDTCKFTTRSSCLQLQGRFFSSFLCSNPELKTSCKKQAGTGCVEGKDGVYWFDSCGNRENIYEANKAKSWNNGRILALSESCTLKSGNNLLSNQKTCGNCNYLIGTVCGVKTSNEKLSDNSQEFVCRDLSCIDKDGKRRSNGESWCAYQGAMGVHEGRSVDTPGSRHYRESCLNGEIRIDPCADYRNEICVQTDSSSTQGGIFSTAACRTNLAYTCYDYNKEGKKDQCEKNPDCFIKKVSISSNFQFSVCSPKYKPGFNLEERGDGAEAICKIGTQTCSYIKFKKLFGKKEINKECISDTFTQQMNDFCMSLGDCGAQANYQGTFTDDGYSVSNAPSLGENYISSIKKYADEIIFKNQKPAEPGEKYFGELGIPGFLGQANLKKSSAFKDAQLANMALGLGGLALFGAAKLGLSLGTAPLFTAKSSIVPATTAFAGAFAGAAVGLAVTSLLLDFTGVGRGLPPALSYALMATGAIAGAIIGYNAAVGGTVGFSHGILGAAAAASVIAIAVIIVVIIIFSFLGIGKKKEITVTFTCKPWQPQLGGKECGKCGQDGFPCSKYACESLGQTCQFINEEEKGIGECVDINPNDVKPPTIKASKEFLPEDYRGEESERGIIIKSSESDGCIKETYQAIPFGLFLDEPGQCRMSTKHTSSFDEMEDLGGRSRFLKNHSLPLMIPSLESLGFENFDSKAKTDYNLFIRCQDKSGNKNEQEYAIQFCIKQGPDTTPPVVVDRRPYLETISFTAAYLNASVYTNEPADCKWDAQDKEYNNMRNQMSCSNEIENLTLFGWECQTTFPVLNNESTYYIKCLDQPWLPDENISQRNSNTQSYQFKIKKSSSQLNIEIIPDNQTFTFGLEPASIEVIVKTSGGLDGTARCTYQWGNSSKIDFYEGTWTSTHRQVFQTIFSGDYFLPIQCEDLAGNIAEKTAFFRVNIDSDYPEIARAYEDRGSLILVTNEHSSCSISINKKEECSFDFANGTLMNGDEFIHTISFTSGYPHFIKCKDSFGHVPGSCTIIVKKGGI